MSRMNRSESQPVVAPRSTALALTIVGISTAFALASPAFGAAATQPPSASEIVQRSVAANRADWKAQPAYAHRERDLKSKPGSDGHSKVEQIRTYEVMMINGSPYNRLIELNGKPLTTVQEEQEKAKLAREVHRRQGESPGDRQQRLGKYQRDRSDERFLMDQMVKAFRFRLTGERQIGGVDCYVLDAEPDPNYQPPVEKARVLTGMKGRLYVDKAQYHWVRVEAEVIHPVEFGLFLAKVKPGTSFELDQAPVGNIWLPKRFTQSVNASVLGIYGMRSNEEEIYSDYHQSMLDASVRRMNQ
jgi:hypothetical protein